MVRSEKRRKRRKRHVENPPRARLVSTAQRQPIVALVEPTTQTTSAQTPAMPAAPGRLPEARFVSGPILNHILVMTGTSALGLMAIFSGDLANLLFLGQLHDTEVLAAVGYASTLLFFATSINIGISIGATAVVAPAIGAGRKEDARRLASVALALAVVLGVAFTAVLWPILAQVTGAIGASGRTQALAADYLHVVYPTFPLIGFAMTAGGILRSAGDPRRAMYVTLSGAIINVILDPIFILALHFGLRGAAWASVIARCVMAVVAVNGVGRVHGLLQRPDAAMLRSDVARLLAVGLPAVATNLATPAANAFATKALAGFGDAAVATWSVWGRVNPVAFGAVFALTGSLGPIIGQNLGARNYARIKETVATAAWVTAAFTAFAWLVLAVSPQLIIAMFGLSGDSIPLVYLFCRWLPPLFAFLGFLFAANAVFNTMRHPHYATLFNWGRATLGTIPFVIVGGHLAGAAGVFAGSMISGALFGSAALWVCFRLIDRLAARDRESGASKPDTARLRG